MLLCAQNVSVCNKVRLAKDAAFEFAATAELCRPTSSGHNDEKDAVRHAYWIADVTARADSLWAKRWGDAHEDRPDNPALEREMDLFNNAVGRSIGVMFPDHQHQGASRAAAVLGARDSGALRRISSGALVATSPCP